MTDGEIGDDLKIRKLDPRPVGGTWVSGTLHGHWFEALVFAEHADDPDYELAGSKITKMWVRRMSDRKTVFNWACGPDEEAADDTAKAIIAFLCAGLADHIFSK